MSGELISTLRGKIPQRAIRHIDEMPYVSSYHLSEDVSTIPGVDFGAGDRAFEIQIPASRRAKVIAVNVYEVTETFTILGVESTVEIGDGTDQNGYAYTDNFGALAVDTSAVFTSYDGTLIEGALGAIIPAAVEIVATCVADTTGTPAGRAMVSLDIFYFE